MADSKVTTRAPTLPSVIKEVTSNDLLTPGKQWLGFEAGVLGRRKNAVDASTALLLSRSKQSDAYVALLESRAKISRKYAELIDLPNLLAEEQRQREHARALAETRRVAETLVAAHELQLALARHDVELAKLREQGVRAHRNLEAAQRVKDAEIDRWYQAAAAKRNEAEATRQDTDVDLQRAQPAASADAIKAAMEEERAHAIATIDNEIELAKARGNAAAVMSLQGLKARLKSVA